MNARAIKHRLAFLNLLVFIFCAVTRSQAQIPAYGNLQKQEYGDAVYRQLGFWANIGLDYNHTGVFGGINSGHVLRVMQAKGEASIIPTGEDTTVEVDLAEFNGPSQTYFGAYTKSDLTMSFTGRKSIVATAVSLVNAYIPYVTFDAINFYAGGRGVGYISEIRCDAVVEYAYEANGYAVWWWAGYPNDWSILTFPSDHNDAPTPPSDPSYEFSPWAQRGAPGHSPTYNTYMTRPSVINLPTYQVTTSGGPGYLDVTIQATDESGIHFIGVVKPGETSWTYSPTQQQHPTSASYSWTTRVTNSGTLYYAAIDNGGNAPTTAQTPSVIVSVPPPDTTRPTVTIVNPAANARFTNDAVVAVQGTAADNVQVAAVNYQLNGGGWNAATGTANWQTTVTLAPGTNVFHVFSVDSAGNNSLTNSRNIILVLTAPLGLNIVGKGTVTGATNSQRFEIGKSIALTATPGAGHVLTNWLVQVNGATILSTNKAVPFLMQSNLVVTATFMDVAKPVLTITSPTLNQRWSDAVFTAAGKVTDNGPVAGVSYQLNSGDWNAAQTANGWSNWTASLNLTPGTNTLRAYATDAAGNRSLTNSQKLIYVLTAPLELTIIGKGNVTGATNGQRLEIGKSIVLTATPGTGHVLTNWLVQVNGDAIRSTNKAVPFIMQSNLALTATFADVVKPVITITAPTLNQRWSNAVFTTAGKVTDNGPVAGVSYQLNGGDWNTAQTANGWSNWTASLNLTPGTNTLRAYATDAAGNRSLTNSQKLIYVLTAPLELTLIGKGTVTGATNGQRLEIGKSISMTATPGPGHVLTNWLVQVDGTTIRSTNKAAPFIMQSNLVLTATFADVVKPVLTITAPTLNQRWSNAVFTTAGKVTDNGPVTNVSYQLNGGDWNPAQTANGWSNWTASLNLTPGTNTLRAYATDAAGNQSLTNSQKLIYLPPPAEQVAAAVPVVPLQFESGPENLTVIDGQLQLRLSGPPGSEVVVESSPDLVHWLPIQTSTMPAEGLFLSVPVNDQPAQFFRARLR